MRDGLDLDLAVAWDDVFSVAVMKHSYEPKSPRIITDDDTPALAIKRHDETNIEIVLERPTRINLQGIPPKGGSYEVARVRLWVDDPRAFMAEVRTYI